MHSQRTWTLIANLTAGALKLKATEALGFDPGVDDGVWSAVSGLGGAQPPSWMVRLSEQLAKEDIAHKLY